MDLITEITAVSANGLRAVRYCKPLLPRRLKPSYTETKHDGQGRPVIFRSGVSSRGATIYVTATDGLTEYSRWAVSGFDPLTDDHPFQAVRLIIGLFKNFIELY